MEKFQLGDVVVLKSGGPKMTIVKDYNTGFYATCWFNESKMAFGDFTGKSLIKLFVDKEIEIDIHERIQRI